MIVDSHFLSQEVLPLVQFLEFRRNLDVLLQQLAQHDPILGVLQQGLYQVTRLAATFQQVFALEWEKKTHGIYASVNVLFTVMNSLFLG